MAKNILMLVFVLSLSACSSKDNSTMGGAAPVSNHPPVLTPQLPAPIPPAPGPGPGYPQKPHKPHNPNQPNQYDSLKVVGFVSLQIVQEKNQGNNNISVWSWNSCVRNGQVINKRFSTLNQSIQHISSLLQINIDLNIEGKKISSPYLNKGFVNGLLNFSVRDSSFNSFKQNQISFTKTDAFRRTERLTPVQIPNGYKLIVDYRPFTHNGQNIVANEQVYQQCLDLY